MTEVEFDGPADKPENPFIAAFAQYRVEAEGVADARITVKALDTRQGLRAPDYEIPRLGVLIEVKGAYDRQFEEWSAGLDTNMERLHRAIDGLGIEFHGVYRIGTPSSFRIPRGKDADVARQLVEAAIRGERELSLEGLGDFELERVADEGHSVFLSPDGWTRMVPDWGTVGGEAERLLRKANSQLGATSRQGFTKILLFVQQASVHLDGFYEGLAPHFSILAGLENVHEIWLQRRRAGEAPPDHVLLYTRAFLFGLKEGRQLADDAETGLFARWFDPLSRLGVDFRQYLFGTLRSTLGAQRAHEVFPDSRLRESMIRLGEWLGETGRFAELEWLVSRFIDDPDPPKLEEEENPCYERHLEVAAGKDPLIITSVLGHTAWVARWLALDRTRISSALTFTERLLDHPNLYIHYEALFPLAEIAGRRSLLDGFDVRPHQGDYGRFRGVVVTQLQFLRTHPEYTSIARRLCHVVDGIHELETGEALDAWGALKSSEESVALLVRWAFFQDDAQGRTGRAFDREPFRAELGRVLASSDAREEDLRSSVMWHFWQIGGKDQTGANLIEPYVDIYLRRRPFTSEGLDDAAHLAEDALEKGMMIGGEWYARLLESALAGGPEVIAAISTVRGWAVWNSEAIMSLMAAKVPGLWERAARALVDLCRRGVNPAFCRNALKTYRAIPDPQLREAAESYVASSGSF
ncbi:MAG: hypothetical protein AAB152_18920 [Candidatus Coatesbacteria bacterium]